ncbi:MAG: CpaF family protein, partial [Anaerolineales bacterium]|nr:CpaF family protein [Anaerolineales bacterium]
PSAGAPPPVAPPTPAPIASLSSFTGPSLTLPKELLARVVWLAEKIEPSIPEASRYKRDAQTEQAVREKYQAAVQRGLVNVPPAQERAFLEALIQEITGFGPLELLLSDDSISEIMVNGPNQTYVEKGGKISEIGVNFADSAHIERIIQKIVKPLGREVNRRRPMSDARLPDGSRVNVVIPPCAIDGASLTIRKFRKNQLTIEDLIKYGSLTPEMAKFLEACVVSKLNIIVSGGSSSGKTSLLNVLSGFIPAGERIVTIEDAAELSLKQPHVIRAEAKKPNRPGDSEVSIRDLVKNALRMRPDRIIVGEVRGGEALDMLQAMNTGHEGSLTSIHSNTPRDMVSRLETLILMSGVELPLDVIRKQIASSIDLIVQQARLRDGSRKIINITEMISITGETVTTQDVFLYEEQGEQNGQITGRFVPGGFRPRFDNRLKVHGYDFPPSMFIRPDQQARLNQPDPRERRR